MKSILYFRVYPHVYPPLSIYSIRIILLSYLKTEAIKDFIFHLHEATRCHQNIDTIHKLYDGKFRELSEKYFSQCSWPSAKHVAPECSFDDDFLLFYREMAQRHLFSKQKPTLSDHLEAWNSYMNLFAFLMSSNSANMMISPQWAHEIVQEFVYHFQDFCQFRAQVSHRPEEEINILQINKNVWSLAEMKRILNGLSNFEAFSISPDRSCEPIHELIGYFSMIENARLECLLGDYTSSLHIVDSKKILDRSELLYSVPTCHANASYHAGICMLMSRKYASVVDILGDVILQISRQLKPGAAVLRPHMQQSLQKTLDKIMATAAIAVVLNPGQRVDDQVLEIIDGKWNEKMKRMQFGDLSAFMDVFETNCPKFISPAYPDFTGTINPCHEAFKGQIAVFANEISRQVSKVKIRSFLRLYSSIEVTKMAALNDSSEKEFTGKLLAHKCRVGGQNSLVSEGIDPIEVPQSDIHYYVQRGNLLIESSSGKNDRTRASERYFTSGVRKHSELMNSVVSCFDTKA